ncbi:hypothetical protein ACKI16_24345 [Streptomyces scabiei]|uniref:hypothetical protein n=1 Tax=Streptomyces scabiei TaxID=1930 RepID=UPI0038F6B1EC
MTKHRHTADSITDDALDELYENANEGWRRGDRWKERAEKAEADRAAALLEAAQHLYVSLFPAVYDDMGQKAAEGVQRAVSELRRLAAEAQPASASVTDVQHMLTRMRANASTHDLGHLLRLIADWYRSSEGRDALFDDLIAAGYRLPEGDEPAAEAPTTTKPETEALAAMFEGLGLLLATSSRDWGLYAPDAWLYAVVLGWDCEQAEHDETCTHGAMEEMQQRHGWSDEAVAKARRYRAAVRALTEPAAGVRQDGAQQPTTTPGPEENSAP